MIARIWNSFKHIHYAWHIFFSAIIRAIFIVYGIYHDKTSLVQYTDVDYKVFTDASRHVLNNESPYNRHTYRYSPLVAYILIPNVTLDFVFGKILFSLSDLLVGLLIRKLVIHMLKEYDTYKQKTEHNQFDEKLKVEYNNTSNLKNIRNRKKGRNVIKSNSKFQILKTENDLQADIAMIVWLYNPLSIAISTRGNCDSIAGLLVLLTLYFLQCKKHYFVTGIIHGISVHYRLYPIIYSLAMYMYLSKYSYYTTNRFKIYNTDENNLGRKIKEIKYIENKVSEEISDIEETERKTIFKRKYLAYLLPNFNQLKLVSGCLFSLITLTYFFYHIYGYKFLYETYIYHLIRKDTRHNFSVFFYLQYLTAGVKNIGLWQKVLIVLPQLILLLLFSMRYGLNRFSFNFSIVVLTITMVTYNTVLTSQYFVWILVVLPLCIWQIKISAKMALGLLCIWFAAQAAWLMPAYFLEFKGQNSFLFIWLQSVSFFCANIAILGRMIMNFMPLKKHKA